MYVRKSRAISAALAAIVVVILLVAIIAGVYFYLAPGTGPASSTGTTSSTTSSSGQTTSTSSSGQTTSTSSSGQTTSTSSTTTGPPIPNTLTYEWAETTQYLDPSVAYLSSDYNVIQNVYEPLMSYNGSSTTLVVPWLAQTVVSNAAGTQYNFTLRSGIQFADGEPLNSTSVYFGLYRGLVFDGSTPTGHCTQAGWLIEQEVNSSMSCFFGTAQTYGNSYADAWLASNFVSITGPMTFTLNVKTPNAAFLSILTQPIGYPLPPSYIMQHDLSIWTGSSAQGGYTLPNPTPSGSLVQQITQYLEDLSSTCNKGPTPNGCGATYLNHSEQGSKAGTAAYTIASVDLTNNVITLLANPNYWGGAYQFSAGQKIVPRIQNILFKFVPDQTTREIDLKNAARSGQAVAIDLSATNLLDIADRNQWLQNGKLVSDVSGVNIYGPYSQLAISFDPFDLNVTNPFTGQYQKFQPFADLRIRTAFADSVNMTAEWASVDNKLGQPAPSLIPPGLPPNGVYNTSITPAYSFNPDKAAQLLLDAMTHPITHFTFTNGTVASGVFNNTFGCASLGSNGKCSNPVQQTVTLTYPTGDTVDESIFNDMAATLTNISISYNMGLTVAVVGEPLGTMVTQAFTPPASLYMYALGWFQDYPWVLDFTLNMLTYPGTYPGGTGWNLAAMNTLYKQCLADNQANNVPALVSCSSQMNQLANNAVMYLWTFDSVNYVTMTSNVQGLLWNSNAATAAFFGVGPEYFATLY